MTDFVNISFFKSLKISFLCFLLAMVSVPAFCEESHGESGEFNPGEVVLHHIKDSHEWHFWGSGHEGVTLPLPIILYSNTKGIVSFMSSEFKHGEESYNGYKIEHDHILSEDPSEKIIDFSITKNVASLLLSAFLLITIFTSVGSAVKANRGKAPKGIQALFEPFVAYIRDEIAIPNIGEKKYARYLPYLLTIFFFVWFNNLLGQLPGGANLSGNIGFTLVLATFTLIITVLSGNKDYWRHIFAMPGVPLYLYPIMIPLEVFGIFTKPVALTIRLFANITAGHMIILSIVSLIFIFKSLAVAAVSVPFGVAIGLLEMFVAILQAYLFTLLSALFIGQAVAEHEHSHDDHH